MSVEEVTGEQHAWASRPWAARSVKAFVLLVPLAASISFAYLVGLAVPIPDHFGWNVVRWLSIAICSTVVLVAVDRLARRVLPLATLFNLTLTFPDQAPSRYRLALRSGSVKLLSERVAAARAGQLGDTPAEAAERVLELVAALSHHDRLTRGHSERVRAYAQMIGEEMGLTGPELDRLRWAALLHDVGKLTVPAEILNKPDRLTDEEFEVIKTHPAAGRRLVAPLVPWLGRSAAAVWEHHERFDGNGYPAGLRGTQISLAARIVSVADVFDVMTSARSYKKPMSPAAARKELTRCAGTQFDPIVVRAFMSITLGRLRFAMGPMSWLAQASMFPTAISTTAATSGAAAVTAVAGATSAVIGMGDAPGLLDRIGITGADHVIAAEQQPDDEVEPLGDPSTTTIRLTPTTDPGRPRVPGVVGAPTSSIAGAPSSAPTTSPSPSPSPSTTTPPSSSSSSSTSSSVVADPSGAAAPTTQPVATATTSPPPPSTPAASTTSSSSTTSTVSPTSTSAPAASGGSTTTSAAPAPTTTSPPTTARPPGAPTTTGPPVTAPGVGRGGGVGGGGGGRPGPPRGP